MLELGDSTLIGYVVGSAHNRATSVSKEMFGHIQLLS